jgi:hypothetical protein
MKTFISVVAVIVFGVFIYAGSTYFSNINENNKSGISTTSSISSNEAEASSSAKELEEATSLESASPENVSSEVTTKITPPGTTVKAGDSAYYQLNKSIIKVRVLGVNIARPDLNEAVKLDIPEATPLEIWTITFEQFFEEGKEIYGTYAGFDMFNVKTSDGSPAYILNTTGDYLGCPSKSLFEEDFEERSPYSQCIVVGSTSEPNLIFVGSSGSEYATNPIIFK